MSYIERADIARIKRDPSREPQIVSLGNGRWTARDIEPHRFAAALRTYNEKRRLDYQRRRDALQRLEAR